MTGSENPIIEFQNVSKKYANPVFSNLSFSVQQHNFISFLGPSGCGKSTLLKIIAGLESADFGTVSLQKLKTSFIFQEPRLIPWLNCIDNLLLPNKILNMPEQKQLAFELLNKVHMPNAAKLFPDELSGGMKMRLSLARALMTTPDLLLMDEPFAALDEITRFKMQELTRDFFSINNNLTVIFVTHSMAEAIFLSDKIFIFNHLGQIKHETDVNFTEKRSASLRLQNKYFEKLKEVQSVFYV